MPTIKSRVNGLQIEVPADAAGVVRRFGTPGDNELIFDKQAKPARSKRGDDGTMKVDSIADKKVQPSDLA